MPRPTSIAIRASLLVGTLLALVLLLPATAGAHTQLLRSSPAEEAIVEVAPDAVQLEFGAKVTATTGSIQVFAPDGSRVDAGAPTPAQGTRVGQPIDAGAQGTYGVAYRLSSEDGHVLTDSFTFVVGEASGGSAAADDAREAAQVDPTLDAAFSVARFVELLALLLAAGGGLFVCLVAPTWRPRWLTTALIVLLLAYAAGYVLNAAMVRGTGVGDALTLDAVRDVAETPFALSLQIRAIIALVALAPALLLRFGPPLGAPARWSLALIFAGLAASMSLTGHAVTTDPIELRLPLDMVHVVAAAIWIGGLLQLAYLAPRAVEYVADVRRFSRVAFGAVAVLFLTGVYATWAELGLEPKQLLDSSYGRLIAAKLFLFAGTIPLAWNNMRTYVPRIERRPDDAPRLLRQYIWREAFLLVVVIALTVWLIATPQPS